MHRWELRAVLNALKQILKARGTTYRDVAQAIGVSEVTVKRLFAGTDCSFTRVLDLCEALDVSFFDVTALAHGGEFETHALTEEQDDFFGDHPEHYYILRHLQRGSALADVKERHGLSDRAMRTVLSDLDRLGLIELHAGDKVRMRFRGILSIRPRGSLARRVTQGECKPFLDHLVETDGDPDKLYHVILGQEMAETTLRAMIAELKQVTEKYMKLGYRDERLLPSGKRRTVRCLVGVSPL